jgi:hypothetical protein
MMHTYTHLISFLPTWKVPVVNKLGLLARSSGLEYFQCTDTSEVEKLLEGPLSNGRVIVFADCEHLSFIEMLDRTYKNCNVVLLLSSKLQVMAKQLKSIANVQCMVANHDKDFDARDVLIMLKKFQEEDILGLEKYLGYGAGVRRYVIASDSDKRQAVQELFSFVHGLGGEASNFSEYARRTAELVDELILNGVFNANPRFQKLDRSQPFTLKNDELVHMSYAFDGETFGVSVSDRFGSLTREKILEYLNDVTVTEPVSERESGGLGLKVIFDRLHRFVVNVTPGDVTEAICLLKFDSRIKDFEKRLRSFYYFARPSSSNVARKAS